MELMSRHAFPWKGLEERRRDLCVAFLMDGEKMSPEDVSASSKVLVLVGETSPGSSQDRQNRDRDQDTLQY